MKKIIRFSKFFVPAAVISCLLVVVGIAGFVVNNGFNLGVDFQAGLIQEVQFAPTAFSLKWTGTTNAVFSFDSNGVHIVISGSGVESQTHSFSFNEYATVGSLTQAMAQTVEGLEVSITANANTNSRWLLFSNFGNPYLSSETPFVAHYLSPEYQPIDISEVRAAMSSLGQSVSVQNMGQPQDRHFMIRVQDTESGGAKTEEITSFLEAYFGTGEVIVLRSDFVGSRFSKNLTDQAGVLVILTLSLIFAYSAFRFKIQYAAGLVVGIMYDVIVVIGFVVISRMEFTTSTIAAILTIVGYSANNTIVVFDRVRETRKMYPDYNNFADVLDRSLTETLSRTIITTLSTIVAVMSLFLFTTGSMKDFALALIVGMLSGVYTTTFIATGIVNTWEKRKAAREKRKLAAAAVKS